MRKRLGVLVAVAGAVLVAAAGGHAIGERGTATGYELRSGDQAFMRQAGVRCFVNGALSRERATLESRVVAGCVPLRAGSIRLGYTVRMSDRGILVYKGGRLVYQGVVG